MEGQEIETNVNENGHSVRYRPTPVGPADENQSETSMYVIYRERNQLTNNDGEISLLRRLTKANRLESAHKRGKSIMV